MIQRIWRYLWLDRPNADCLGFYFVGGYQSGNQPSCMSLNFDDCVDRRLRLPKEGNKVIHPRINHTLNSLTSKI